MSRKSVRLENIKKANKRILGESLEFDVNNSSGFGSTYDEVGDYETDIYGSGRYHDPSDMWDRDFNDDEWDEGEEYESFEDYEQSPFYKDKKNKWSNRLSSDSGKHHFDHEKKSRGGLPLRIRRKK